ncbi:MAG: helix-turn-helix domain-containing protein [Rhodoferax sp.]|nr:helix-turn-helix domain-containing protein [Rhodoferax sp.]MDP3653995.1 helix-turn-helix domain-containing protein [Rhodoferax sp.]
MNELNPHALWTPGALPLVLVDVALRGALIALLVLLATVMRRDRPQLAAARVGVAMALGLCAQAISSTPLFEDMVPRLWQAPWVAVSVGNAVLFWVFVQALFDDEFALRPVHAVAWLLAAGLSGLNCAAAAHSASVLAPVTMGVQRAIPLVFAVLAALAAARHWRADLVEERRRLRVFVVASGIAYTLTFLLARLASPRGQLLGVTATLDVGVLLVIVVVLVSRLLRLGSSNLFPSATQPAPFHVPSPAMPGTPNAPYHPPAVPRVHAESGDEPIPVLVPEPAPTSAPTEPTPPPDPAEERLAQALQHLMVVERAYRDEDMSLARLAARLRVPEYRLRKLINQRLGYRNFNAFINGFRLDAVRADLLDPARRDLPVLTLALDAGFQSIGPFNRAFKAATGLTPTEFRKETRPGGETLPPRSPTACGSLLPEGARFSLGRPDEETSADS